MQNTRKDFGTPPPGYTGGSGRGAVGFTTRSDIGPAQDDYGRAPTPPSPAPPSPAADAESVYDGDYDKFAGYRTSLFAGATADRDDLSAERVYAAIDQRMDSRRRAHRLKLAARLQSFTADAYETFSADKRRLAELSLGDWAAIPDAGRQAKRARAARRPDTLTPAPDLLVHAAHELSVQNVDRGGTITPLGGGAGGATPVNLTQLGSARGKVLEMTLGKLSDSVDGQTVVDPKGYLTDLRSRGDAGVSDVEKARLLFQSITRSNPQSAPGWVGAARLEEHAGKLAAARKVALRGCDAVPGDEDVWLEAARLHNPKHARALIARAVTFAPHSEKLWLRATALELTRDAKRAVLRRALALLPGSVAVWKAAVDLEKPADARTLLSKAVRCVPAHVEFWLALARLESHANARKVLNEARQALKSEPRVWIAAAQLEEAHGSAGVGKLVRKALASLRAHGVAVEREFWLRAARECEAAGAPRTCAAIVAAVLPEGVAEGERAAVWRADAAAAAREGRVVTARAVWRKICDVFRGDPGVWVEAVAVERLGAGGGGGGSGGADGVVGEEDKGEAAAETASAVEGAASGSAEPAIAPAAEGAEVAARERVVALLEEAVAACPRDERLWLMLSREYWAGNQMQKSRETLKKALMTVPQSEAICLAAVKIEFENGEHTAARDILSHCRATAETPRLWMKSALLERELGRFKAERDLLETATEKFPKSAKLWMMLGQSFEREGDDVKAEIIYKNGLKTCPKCAALWLCAAKLERKRAVPGKARSLLEQARAAVPRCPALWLATVRLEAEFDRAVAERLLALALRECPRAGELWAFAAEFEAPARRRGRCFDALRALSEDGNVFLAAAKLFWAERKTEKAKNWFERAVNANDDLGDSWAFYYSFLRKHGTDAEQRDVAKRCARAKPRHGERWVAESKKVGNVLLGAGEVLRRVSEGIKM